MRKLTVADLPSDFAILIGASMQIHVPLSGGEIGHLTWG